MKNETARPNAKKTKEVETEATGSREAGSEEEEGAQLSRREGRRERSKERAEGECPPGPYSDTKPTYPN